MLCLEFGCRKGEDIGLHEPRDLVVTWLRPEHCGWLMFSGSLSLLCSMASVFSKQVGCRLTLFVWLTFLMIVIMYKLFMRLRVK
jgi:hypothetical protein